jgi:hypothetical protein
VKHGPRRRPLRRGLLGLERGQPFEAARQALAACPDAYSTSVSFTAPTAEPTTMQITANAIHANVAVLQ